MGAAPHSPLTAPVFWEEEYLKQQQLPARPRESWPVERCLMRALARDAGAAPGERVLEIGCAPGRWMVFYAERFGATVEGLEYTPLGAEQTRANLKMCGVEGDVHEANFWSWQPETPADIVLSLGFIEHFDDIDATFRRHVEMVRPGGRLVLAVPNFQGVNRALQRFCDLHWLLIHNPAAMGLAGYQRRAVICDLEITSGRYVGGFDPDIISVRRRGRRLLAPFWHLRRRGFGDSLNAWWLSSFLLMVFTRPTAADKERETPGTQTAEAGAWE
jgi:2-polyprenyl-3-methyl-5-hydroxy-6-metoxy-1,4-benzoquinol methylase